MTETMACPICNGSGETKCPGKHSIFDVDKDCPLCRGRLKVRCGTCGGTGKVVNEAKEREIEKEKEYERLKELEREKAEREAEREEEQLQKHQRIVSDSWKLEAESKASQAHKLLYSDMLEEAFSLSLEAIKQDPGNIHSYQVAAIASDKMGSDANTKTYLKKYLNLLQGIGLRYEHMLDTNVASTDIFDIIARQDDSLWNSFIKIAEYPANIIILLISGTTSI